MTQNAEGEQMKMEIARVGLCATCVFARVQGSAKASGNRFYRCTRADDDSSYYKYPALPVVGCDGHAPSGAASS